jgi:alpha-N-arabinofuranosidase
VGLTFKLYREHFGITPVQVSGDRPPPTPTKPPGGDQPKKNAGSDTYPLDVAAAWSEDGAALSIAVINPTESEQRMTLNMRGVKVSTGATLWRLAHPDLDYVPTPGKPVAVKIQQQRVAKVGVLTIPRYSVSIYEMRVAR